MSHILKKFTSDRIWPTPPEEQLRQVAIAMSAMLHANSGRPVWTFVQQAIPLAPPDQGYDFEANSDGGRFLDQGRDSPPREWYGRLHLTCAAKVRTNHLGKIGAGVEFDFRDSAFFENTLPDMVVYCTLKRIARHFLRLGKLQSDEIFPWVMVEGQWGAPEYYYPPPYYGIPQSNKVRLAGRHVQLQTYGCSEFVN